MIQSRGVVEREISRDVVVSIHSGYLFNEIDPDLLVGDRIGKHKKGYSRKMLESFAQRLGLTVSGKRKDILIDDIKKIRRDMGFL